MYFYFRLHMPNGRLLYLLAKNHSVGENLVECVVRAVDSLAIVRDFIHIRYKPNPVQTFDGFRLVEVRLDLQQMAPRKFNGKFKLFTPILFTCMNRSDIG